MKRLAILATAAALMAGPALAQQTTITLTPEEETTIYTTLHSSATVGAAPADVSVSVGATLPETVELQPLPDTLKIETVKKYEYAVIGPQVVLVEPDSRKIVKIIKK